MNLGKKIKLVQGTIALIVISFIALVVIGVIGYKTCSKLTKYYTKLSSNDVAIVEKYGNMNGDFNELRVYLTRVIDRNYKEEQNKDVENADIKVREDFEKIKTLGIDDKELKVVKEMEDNYLKYMNIYNDIKHKRKAGLEINAEQTKQITNIGASITDGIKNSILIENSIIADSITEYKSVTAKAKLEFFSVALAAALLLLIVSVIFVCVLRNLLKEMAETIHVIALGDFSQEIDTSSNTEFGNMNKQLHDMKISVSNLLKNITSVASTINNGSSNLSALSEEMFSTSDEVSAAVQQVAAGSTTQAGELMSVNDAVKEFGHNLEKFVLLTGEANNAAGSIGNKAHNSNEQLEDLVVSLNNITNSFEKVINKIKQLQESINQANEITVLINNISDQTNLLALNAAIEAARAGDSGRGFSVVASEIRKLADQSKYSSDKIMILLNDVSSETLDLVKNTGDVNKELINEKSIIETALESFKSIITSVEVIVPDIEKVSSGIKNLNKDIIPVISKIENTSVVSEENSAASEEIAASTIEMRNSAGAVAKTAEKLTSSAEELTKELSKFKLYYK